MSLLYTAHATAYSGREGRVATDDGALDLVLARPKELGGDGKGTNPEQMFACAYSACFGATLQALARARKLALTRNEVTAHVGLVRRDGNGFILSAEMEVTLAGLTREEADALVEAAHGVCPVSNAIRATVDVSFKVTVAQA